MAYANGTPCWVDIGSPDPDKTAAFYGGLFGWETNEPGPVEETGGYRMFTKDGKVVAGLGPGQGPATYWTTYLAADDVDKSVELAKTNGANVVVEPMTVMEAGRMAILSDPNGAVFALWQANQHPGAEVKGEVGSLTWNELLTRDIEGSKAFYGNSFGIEAAEFPMEGGPPYTVLNVDGQGVGGILPMGDELPPEMPSAWLAYFTVEDADDTVAQAGRLGGGVMSPAFDVPTVGKMAWLTGPDGELFAVIQPEQPQG